MSSLLWWLLGVRINSHVTSFSACIHGMCVPWLPPNYSVLRAENADNYFPSHQKKLQEKKLLPNSSIYYSIKSNKHVSFQCTLMEIFSVYLMWCFQKKNYCYLEHYQGKMNPSFLRGIYIKMKLFHPHVVSNTVIYSLYSLGFLSLFESVVQYNTLDLNKLFLDKNKESGRAFLQLFCMMSE